VFKRQLWAWLFFVIGLAFTNIAARQRAQCLLYFTQIEANQSVRQQYCRNAAGPAQAMHGRFANLQYLGKLARSQVLTALVPGMIRRDRFVWLCLRMLSLFSHYRFTGSSENANGTASDSVTSTVFNSVL